MVNSDNLRELLRRTPFVPFRPVASSGNNYDITNPEMVVVMNSEVFIAYPDGDRWAHVPLAHIAWVEALQAA